ncbi:putative bifunctional SAT/APS kinase [bacterium BMS3Bbin12]|nr:putative bifunctional SAT/APS kinase [bacterium BMS3Abin12]GBE48817.1 putative bifunctional SAT/APS kinase [bacterium BMS3Bbin12]GBE49721.1 putative bifunctional SAT/APS kinase [bacterium BMS3Bbin13]
MDFLIPPHGGTLCRQLAAPESVERLKGEARAIRAVVLSPRQISDLDLLLNGGFSPLRGFLGRADYESVLDTMRLESGLLWPIPVTLDVPDALAEGLTAGERLALQDPEGFTHALLSVGDVWRPDKRREAEAVYGTTSDAHPGVRYLYEQVHDTYVGGPVEGIEPPAHYDFENLWDTPEKLRRLFARLGWRQVLAFQPPGPIHRREREIVLAAAKETQAHVLLHPAVGVTTPGDLHYYARVRGYQAVRGRFPHGLVALSLLPLARRQAGPRSALWHAIVHQNHGCSHLLIEPYHGAPAPDGRFYEPLAAQELLARHESELALRPVPVEELRYVPRRGCYLPASVIERDGETASDLGEEELRRRLSADEEIPDWFSYPEVIDELRRVYPPRSRQGFTLFFTGLSGAGKSTLAKLIYAKLVEAGGRPVTLLDGDIVRRNLSSELGFSRAHRDLNVRRIGFVASEITKNGGVALCAPIAPYAATRRAVRECIAGHGAFIEIHVATPLEVCEARDRKGLYEKARKGLIPEFTGISDPYEVPEHPEIRLDTTDLSPVEAAQEIFLFLLREGYLDSVT